MRIGIFGGTFDPPHLGHVRLAHAARNQLDLSMVLWVVTADPPHKQAQPLSPIRDRLTLVQAAIAADPTFVLSRVDVDRPGPHWTADTVALLAEQFPTAELVYLMGGDSLRDLPRWGRPLEILRHCQLGVLRRPQDTLDSKTLADLERALPGVSAKIEFVDAPPLAVASNEIRRRILAGEDWEQDVPIAVAALIKARGLYRET